MWGNPNEDKLGTVTQFVYTVLNIPANERVRSVIYSGPSTKDGLTEGAYTKRFLTDRIDRLSDFASLKKLIDNLTSEEYAVFAQRIRELVVGPLLRNTFDEVMNAASFLNEDGEADRIFQISAPGHAPRCLQNQLIARQNGLIPARQPWCIVASDVNFYGTDMSDVVILEPPHRGDDPMVGYDHTLPGVLKPYFSMSTHEKQRLIDTIQELSGS